MSMESFNLHNIFHSATKKNHVHFFIVILAQAF